MPVVTFIDAWAYPDWSGGAACCRSDCCKYSRYERFEVPIVTVVIGEGGSGGALGMAVADEVMILEMGIIPLSPEGCAAILWKDRAAAPKAAEALRFSPEYLKNLVWLIGLYPNPWVARTEIMKPPLRPSRRLFRLRS